MDRRTYVALAAGTALTAGCLGSGDDDEEDDGDDGNASDGGDGDGDDSTDSAGDEANVEMLIEAIEEEFEPVEDQNWTVEDGVLEATYLEVDGQDEDIDVAASVYAVAVETGVDLDVQLTAMADADTALYTYEIQQGWAESYNEGDLSEESYVENIVETVSDE